MSHNKRCRTCLQPSIDSIFKQVSLNKIQIPLVDMLKLCTGLEVTKSDKISLYICNNCTANIIKIYLFRQTCLSSHNFLLNELQNRNNADSTIGKQVDDNKELTKDTNCELGVEVPDNVPNDVLVDGEDRLDTLEQINNNEKIQPTNLVKSQITYTKKQALSIYCEFVKTTSKREYNGAWKCRKCGNINIRTLRMLQHLVRNHKINIKIPITNVLKKKSDSLIEKTDEDLADVLTKHQALSTYTFYPYLDQVDSNFPRTTQECLKCSYTNIAPNPMIHHLRNSHSIQILDWDEYKCTKCDVKCRSYYFLVLHEKTHDETAQQPIFGISRRSYECSKCDSKFETQFNLNRHMGIHVRKLNVIMPKRTTKLKKNILCEHCGETFTTTKILRDHVRTHTGEKPYSCKICDFRSSHQSSMMFHMRLHCDIRPYKCGTCNRSFVSNSGLAAHRFVHSNEMPFECTICKKKFKSDSGYRLHLKSHDPDTYLACEYCKRKFSKKYNLDLHRKQHTGEKPHSCKFCEKRFIQRRSWRLHLKNHHANIVK